MQLFEKDSAYDLALRGFSQEYILNKTGFDVGYHNSKIKSDIKDVDRTGYKVAYILKNYDSSYILDVIADYSKGLSKDGVLERLGVCGDRMVQLKVIFAKLGFEFEFKAADKAFRKFNMKNGAIEKYGVDNVFKLQEMQDVAKQTRIDKYGAPYTLCDESSLCEQARKTYLEHMCDDEFRTELIKRRKETCLYHFGVEAPAQSEIIREKMRQTSLERYGVEHYAQTEFARQRSHEYMLEHGVEIAEKSKLTCLKKYGVEYYTQTDEARQSQSQRMIETGRNRYIKMRETMMNRYGVEYSAQMDKRKQELSERMLLHSAEYLEKARQTSLLRYGVPYYTQTPLARQQQSERMLDAEYNNRIIETKRKNNTLNTSRVEKQLHRMLVDYFGENDVLCQYKDSRYPFRCDFYIKSRDMFIELNAFWTHWYHWYNGESVEDSIEAQKRLSDNREFYHLSYDVWTKSDVKKRYAAMKHNLNYIVFWACDLRDAKMWFELGCPNGCDWKTEYSWASSGTQNKLKNP